MNTTQQEQKTEVEETSGLSYEKVRDAVRAWPPQLRIVLMRELLDTLTEPAEAQERKRKSLFELFGMLKTDKPAPSDEDVARWLDERRMERYG